MKSANFVDSRSPANTAGGKGDRSSDLINAVVTGRPAPRRWESRPPAEPRSGARQKAPKPQRVVNDGVHLCAGDLGLGIDERIRQALLELGEVQRYFTLLYVGPRCMLRGKSEPSKQTG